MSRKPHAKYRPKVKCRYIIIRCKGVNHPKRVERDAVLQFTVEQSPETIAANHKWDFISTSDGMWWGVCPHCRVVAALDGPRTTPFQRYYTPPAHRNCTCVLRLTP